MSNPSRLSAESVITDDGNDDPTNALDFSGRFLSGESASGHILTPNGGAVLVQYVEPRAWATLAAEVALRGDRGAIADQMRAAGADDSLEAAAAAHVALSP